MKSDNLLVGLAVVLLLIVFTNAQGCPNGCSGHGTCNGGICNCLQGYAGIDCSVRDLLLTNGQSMNGTVGTYQWDYYHIDNPVGGNGMLFVLNQTGAGGDCDVYVYYGDYPTRTRFILRDTGTSPNVALSVQHADPGWWYIGVFGFSYCSYRIMASVTSSCPNGCSGHGTCLGYQCTCNPPWSGPDCSVDTPALYLNNPKRNQNVGLQAWKYYSIHLTTGNFLNVVMTSTSNTDCDLYMKYGSTPLTYDYDYANTTVSAVSSISITGVRLGYWFVGVYGYSACTFDIVAHGAAECPNQCSAHGNCANQFACNCFPGYVGSMCETYNTSLALQTSYNGFVDDNAWNYWFINSFSTENLVIMVQQTGEAGEDCDLYVRAGQQPDLTHYDKYNTGSSNNFSIIVSSSSMTRWWIGVYGYYACSYSLFLEYSAQCLKGCNHGVCDNTGQCVCQAGWSGDLCDIPTQFLTSGNATSGSVIKNQWNYYAINATGALYITMRERGDKGMLWLFASQFTFPTLRVHDYSDKLTNTRYHRVSALTNSTTPVTYFIGVYGGPFIIHPSDSYAYDLVAWASPFF